MVIETPRALAACALILYMSRQEIIENFIQKYIVNTI